ncbi:MAG TPA: HdeD family acid-resistance protein [Bryobacteraceae bacterium]|jgi:uncharacterized membrane protein HdeD (DUF308 family)|nr:HdeD family acid-resistance protein [Bryobacteraceae bacterium]
MNGIAELRKNWGWMLAFGILSILWGIFAITYSVVFTVVSVLTLAWLLIIGGVIEAVHSIRHRERGHLFLYVLEALLAIVVGALLLRSPAAGALVITLLLASYFIVAGMFRIVAALMMRLPGWGWALANGIVTLLLGIFVWGGWPVTGMWVLGVFLGVNLLFTGWVRVMLALALRQDHFTHALPA